MRLKKNLRICLRLLRYDISKLTYKGPYFNVDSLGIMLQYLLKLYKVLIVNNFLNVNKIFLLDAMLEYEPTETRFKTFFFVDVFKLVRKLRIFYFDELQLLR